MWLFTKTGFYSIVQDHNDHQIFKIRARKKKDLENLLKEVSLIEDLSIHTDTKADYRHRLFVNQDQLRVIMQHLTKGIDYPNFKDSVYVNKDQRDKLDSYHKVWDTMYEYQTQQEHEQY